MEQEFLKEIVARLESMGVPYAITGSIASNVWGTPRTTHDVDILVVLTGADIIPFVKAFSSSYYVSEPAVTEAVLRGTMFNVLDPSKGVKADFWLTPGDPFSGSMLIRRRRIEIVPGQEAYVGSPEDVLLHKLVWNQLNPSSRQLNDAAGIAAVQAGQLDLVYLREWANRQGTAEMLEQILQGKFLKRT